MLVDLTASYDTPWLHGLTCRLLRLLPDKHMVRMIAEIILSKNFILVINNSKQSRLRRLKKGVLKGPLLAYLLFNTYFYDLPASEYAYADGLALIHAAGNWQALETVLSQDMTRPSTYLMKWRLKLLTIDFDDHRKAKQKWYR